MGKRLQALAACTPAPLLVRCRDTVEHGLAPARLVLADQAAKCQVRYIVTGACTRVSSPWLTVWVRSLPTFLCTATCRPCGR